MLYVISTPDLLGMLRFSKSSATERDRRDDWPNQLEPRRSSDLPGDFRGLDCQSARPAGVVT